MGKGSSKFISIKHVQRKIQNMLCQEKILKPVKYLEGLLGHCSYCLILYHLGIRLSVNTTMRLLVTDAGGVSGLRSSHGAIHDDLRVVAGGGMPAALPEVRHELPRPTISIVVKTFQHYPRKLTHQLVPYVVFSF
ncbi:hypothetical protein VPH35_008174 [Triticum aestivum]